MTFFGDLKEGSKKYGEEVAFLINCVLLSFAYLVGVGLTWIVARVFHKRFMALAPEPSKTSYWEKSTMSERKKEEYYRQF